MSTRGASRIFICYRRQEASDLAGWLYDQLASYFGRQHVFVDVKIEHGDKFAEVIARKLDACEVLLAVIGPQWLEDSQGRRRLEDPDDFVRLEIEAALWRDVRVIPILIKGAVMPGRSDLPESLAGLADRHALPIRADSFRFDVERLISEMSPAYRWRRLSLAVGVLLMLAAVSFIAQSFMSVASVFSSYSPTLIADAAAAFVVGVVGVGILAARTRPSVAVGGGILLGASPFLGLRVWRSAEVRGAVWGELQAVSAVATGMALALIILLLAVDPAGRFGYQRPSSRTDPTLIVLGTLSPVALSLVGGSIPTSDFDFGTLRFSDPMVVASFAVLAGLVILTQGALQGGILAGWTGGAAFVLANTVALRVQSDPALASILTAQLLLCSYTVAILAATAALALRGDR